MIQVGHPASEAAGAFTRGWGAVIVAAAALLLVALIASGVGALSLPMSTTLTAAWHFVTGQATPGLEGIAANLRFPRVTLAALTGAALGASGAALQGVFRNPLADPYLLGVASGAVFGVTLTVTLSGGLAAAYATSVFAPGVGLSLLPLSAFAGALGAVLLAAWLARGRGAGSLVLAGVIVGSILTALSTFIMLRDADRLRAVFSWTLGNLTLAGWADVRHAWPYVLVALVGLMLAARPLDALQLGEDTAGTLGLNVARARLLIVAAASLATAAVVAFSGPIGFIGLVAPHAMRRLSGPRHVTLIPASALAGACLLILADLVARTITRPGELPVGLVTTLLGGPAFLWLARRRS